MKIPVICVSAIGKFLHAQLFTVSYSCCMKIPANCVSAKGYLMLLEPEAIGKFLHAQLYSCCSSYCLEAMGKFFHA